MKSDPVDYERARRHLSRRDIVLRPLLKLLGPCTLQLETAGFAALARSIVAQQISTHAARAIIGRLELALGSPGWMAPAVLALSEDQLRAAGLSAAKVRSVRDLALKVEDGTVPLDRLSEMDDESVIAALIPVRGIGRWTAQMFLMFSLGRPDVLPVDDLGLRSGVRRHYDLDELPDRALLTEIGERWKPYRSIGTWYIWRSLGGAPDA